MASELRQARRNAKVSQLELAKALGIQRGTLIEVERGNLEASADFIGRAMAEIHRIAQGRANVLGQAA